MPVAINKPSQPQALKQSTTDEVLTSAANLSATGRLNEAATALSDALRQDESAHEVRYQLSLIEAQLGHLTVAEELARGAASTGGDIYARGLGHILGKIGNLKEAEVWLIRALRLDANDAWAHANLGAVYGDQRKLEEALACLEMALSIQPDFPWAQSAQKSILGQRKFLERVRATYVAFAGRRDPGFDPQTTDQTEIEFPSAALDANGLPRFVMEIPVSLLLSDLGAAHLFYREVADQGYEFALRRFLDLQLRSDDVFIDVGAHWGIHSLSAATRLPKEVSVLAIEPNAENSARLKRWVERNRVESEVEIIPKAVGDREGVAHMRVNGSSMGHRLTDDGVEVDMTTLDKVLADRDWLRWRRIFLKIDVEGYELEVLAGAKRLFSVCQVAAVIWEKADFHETTVQGNRNSAIFDFLDRHGFEHYRFEDEALAGPLIPLKGNEGTCNIYSLASIIGRL